MSKQFIQNTSGWIPLSVLALLAIALIAGQARANLPNGVKATPAPVAATSITIVLNTDTLKKLEALPRVADMLLALPAAIELTIDAKLLTSDERDNRSVRLRSR